MIAFVSTRNMANLLDINSLDIVTLNSWLSETTDKKLQSQRSSRSQMSFKIGVNRPEACTFIKKETGTGVFL